jgi:hypothetical protein
MEIERISSLNNIQELGCILVAIVNDCHKGALLQTITILHAFKLLVYGPGGFL